jgi:dihydroorotase-like cyclic amidohydrolase
MTLIIRGAVFHDGRIRQTGVRVENGVITAVSDGDLGAAAQIVDLGPRELLLPAGVDGLCAMRDWNEAPRDTVETVTKAALSAGVTVVCDQANTSPRINVPERIRERSAFVAQRSYTDFGIAAHPPADHALLEEYREAGAHTLQLFPWELRPWLQPADIDDSAATFRRFAQLGLPAFIFVDEFAFRETALQEAAESFALRALLPRLDPALRARLFVTLPESVDLIQQHKARLPNVSILSAPHYVLISREAAHERIGVAAMHSPPLRSATAAARMREYAQQGKIDVVVSQHTPHRMPDKYNTDPVPNEFKPKAGFSSIDITYPLLLTELGVERACQLYCEAPARLLGLKQGAIAVGFEADLAIIECHEGAAERQFHVAGGLTPGVWQVDPGQFQSRGLVTPFVGQRLAYRVNRTYLRGELAYDRATGGYTRRAVRQVHA